MVIKQVMIFLDKSDCHSIGIFKVYPVENILDLGLIYVLKREERVR